MSKIQDTEFKMPTTVKEALKMTGFCVANNGVNTELIRTLSAAEVAYVINKNYITAHKNTVCLIQPEALYNLFAEPSSFLYVVKAEDRNKRIEFNSDMNSGDKSIYLGPCNFTPDNIRNTVLSIETDSGIVISELSYGDEKNSVLVFSHAHLTYHPHSESGGVLGYFKKITHVYSPQNSFIIKNGLPGTDLRRAYRADSFKIAPVIIPTFSNIVEIARLSYTTDRHRLLHTMLTEGGKVDKTQKFCEGKLLMEKGNIVSEQSTQRMVKSFRN